MRNGYQVVLLGLFEAEARVQFSSWGALVGAIPLVFRFMR